ncbi:MAG TPA: pseudouridine synthase [Candidatus Saccharimonadia bacterium]|jgi:23S rRNA pseudouridine2605 synthase
MNTTRINQFVAAASGMSRRAADTAVAAGRVQLGDHTAKLGELVEPDTPVSLDGQLLTPPLSHQYVLLHKPVGYVSSRTRQGQDPTLYELLPAEMRKLRIAGRLDRDSSGLVLLSDDGPFINRYTHPSFGKTKLYELTLDRALTGAARRQLESGVELTDGPSRLRVVSLNGRDLIVALTEGRNRQIRRTLGALGYAIARLHRTAIGPYELSDLPAGNWQEVGAQ